MNDKLDVQQIVQFIAWNRVPYALLVVAIGWLLLQLSVRFIDELSERFTERRLLLKKVKAFWRFFVYLAIAVIVGSAVLEVQNEALFAVLGTIGLAVGFAFKDEPLVKRL